MPTTPTHWTLAARAAKMNPSVIREILKVTEKPGIISFAGGLPSSKTFPVAEFDAACAKVLRDDPAGALQYAASEGYGPLRELVLQLSAQSAAAGVPWNVDPAQVLITTGSQQGLDLVAKVLIDAGSKMLVESPTYLGAVMAFTPMEPNVVSVATDDDGIDIADLVAKCRGCALSVRAAQLPEPDRAHHVRSPPRRTERTRHCAAACPSWKTTPMATCGLTRPPPAPLTARNPDGCIYLGSFSKVLAPGLRMGFLVAPKAVYPKLLQAKQAADLHSPGFNQRMIVEVMQGRFSGPPCAHHPRAVQDPARRHAGGAGAPLPRCGHATRHRR